jgi:hypothetical protein
VCVCVCVCVYARGQYCRQNSDLFKIISILWGESHNNPNVKLSLSLPPSLPPSLSLSLSPPPLSLSPLPPPSFPSLILRLCSCLSASTPSPGPHSNPFPQINFLYTVMLPRSDIRIRRIRSSCYYFRSRAGIEKPCTFILLSFVCLFYLSSQLIHCLQSPSMY